MTQDEADMRAGRTTWTPVHISQIRVGDVVMHQGAARTVGRNNLRRDPFMGQLLFGDCYCLGHKPVTLVTFNQPKREA